jgi:hypothetical protein
MAGHGRRFRDDFASSQAGSSDFRMNGRSNTSYVYVVLWTGENPYSVPPAL